MRTIRVAGVLATVETKWPILYRYFRGILVSLAILNIAISAALSIAVPWWFELTGGARWICGLACVPGLVVAGACIFGVVAVRRAKEEHSARLITSEQTRRANLRRHVLSHITAAPQTFADLESVCAKPRRELLEVLQALVSDGTVVEELPAEADIWTYRMSAGAVRDEKSRMDNDCLPVSERL